MKNNSIIEFDYNGRHNTETTHRLVHPYQILIDEGVCFVFGFCELRNAERLFCLSRIKNLVITDEHFILPENYEFSSRCGGAVNSAPLFQPLSENIKSVFTVRLVSM